MWLYGNSYTWAHDVRLQTIHHVPKCMSSDKAIVVITGRHNVFMIAYILCPSYFEHAVCRGSLMTTYITLLA